MLRLRAAALCLAFLPVPASALEAPTGVPMGGMPMVLSRGTIALPGLEFVPQDAACAYSMSRGIVPCRSLDAMFTGMEGRLRHLTVRVPFDAGRVRDLTWYPDWVGRRMEGLRHRYVEHAVEMTRRGARPMAFLGHAMGAGVDPDAPSIHYEITWKVAGVVVPKVNLVVLDRRGWVQMLFEPTERAADPEALAALTAEIVAGYASLSGEGWLDLQPGDPVSPYTASAIFDEMSDAGLAQAPWKRLARLVKAAIEDVLPVDLPEI